VHTICVLQRLGTDTVMIAISAPHTYTMFIHRYIIDNFFFFEDSWFRFIGCHYYYRLLWYCDVSFRCRFSLLVLFILWPCCVPTRWPVIIIIIIIVKIMLCRYKKQCIPLYMHKSGILTIFYYNGFLSPIIIRYLYFAKYVGNQ